MFTSVRMKLFAVLLLSTALFSGLTVYFLYRISVNLQMDALRRSVLSVASISTLMIDPDLHRRIDPDRMIVDVAEYEINDAALGRIGAALLPEKVRALKSLAGKKLSADDLERSLADLGFTGSDAKTVKKHAAVEYIKRIRPTKLKRELDAILYRVARGNADIRYVYTLEMTDNPSKCKFILASDDYEKAFVDPVETYYDVSRIPELRSREAFTAPVATKDFYRDMWGTWITGFAPLKDRKGKVIATVGADISASKIGEYQARVRTWALLIFVTCLVLSILLSLGISGSIGTPLVKMAEHTRSISAGDFTAKVHVDSGDELRTLADSFNSMTEKLDKLFSNLHLTQEELIRSTCELEESNRKLNRRIAELTSLYTVCQAMNRTDDVDELLITILDAILKAIDSEQGSIMLVDEETETLILRVYRDEFLTEKSEIPLFRIGEGVAGFVAQSKKAYIANKGHEDPLFVRRKGEGAEADLKIRNLLCVPMVLNEKAIGVMNVLNKRREKSYDEEDLELLSTLATQSAVIIEKARLHELAIIDGLTQLYIPRYFQICFDQEILRSKRYGHQVGLIMFDVDHFKEINDT
jgi:HAMP domain-containing protein/putative methionine-R-sulfoxide reductase with GAF domain